MRVLLLCALSLLIPAIAVAGPKEQPDPGAPNWNPDPGAEKVGPTAPTWCAGYKPSPMRPATVIESDVRRGDYTEQTLRTIAELACDRPDNSVRQQWAAFYRQGWINRIGISEKDDRATMAARIQGNAEVKRHDDACKALFKKKDLSPQERELNEATAVAVGCRGAPNEVERGELASLAYWVDAAADAPDELVRVAFVLRCLNGGGRLIDASNVAAGIGSYTFCGHDARKLNRARFDQEVAALKLPALTVAKSREVFAYTAQLATAYAASVKELGAKDKDYARIAIDAPAAGFAAWEKTRAAEKASFDAASKLQEGYRAGVKSAVAGCGPTLRKLLKARVLAAKPRTADDVVDAANDDVSQPLLQALVVCDAFEGRSALAVTEMKLLRGGRVRRGPRTAAFWSSLDVLAEVVKDKTKFPLQPARFGAPLPRLRPKDDNLHQAYESTFNQTSFDRDQKGQVKSVKPQGDGVVVTFKTESYKSPIYDCKETNKILRINPDGRVEYRQDCVAKGMETIKETTAPVWIRKELADGIKPGTFLIAAVDNKPNPREGYPLEVHADAARKKAVAWWGFSLQ